MTIRAYHKVTVIVREQIQKDKTALSSKKNEVLLVLLLSGFLAEDAAVRLDS